jgi:hypothetical protein
MGLVVVRSERNGPQINRSARERDGKEDSGDDGVPPLEAEGPWIVKRDHRADHAS